MRRFWGLGCFLLVVSLSASCGDEGPGSSGGAGGSGGIEEAECASHGECPDERPECVEGACQPCTSTAGCEGRGVCEAATGLCVECMEDEDCPGRGECIEKSCTECAEDRDCPSGRCTFEKTCEPPRSCANGPCSSGLVCVGADRLCWPQCDIYGGEDQCLEGYACALVAVRSGRPEGACILDTGTAQAGAICGPADQSLCSLGLICSVEPLSRVCREFCDPDSEEECAEGMECDRVTLGTTPPVEVGVCRPPISRCEIADECEEDEFCDRGVCLPRPGEGTKGPGEACEDGEECASGFCHEFGVCSGSCGTSEDCPEGTGCMDVLLADGVTGAPACVPHCDTDADCGPAEFCGLFVDRTQTELVSTCRGQAVGPRAAGEDCTVGSQCRSGTCMGSTLGGYCQGRCQSDDDCAGENLGCRDQGLSFNGMPIGNAKMCGGHSCRAEAECGEWSCQPRVEGEPPGIVFRCEPPTGPLEGGASCLAHEQCRSGFCTSVGCLELCSSDVDCESGLCLQGLGLEFEGEFYATPTCL